MVLFRNLCRTIYRWHELILVACLLWAADLLLFGGLFPPIVVMLPWLSCSDALCTPIPDLLAGI
jgi:hypothetical protein